MKRIIVVLLAVFALFVVSCNYEIPNEQHDHELGNPTVVNGRAVKACQCGYIEDVGTPMAVVSTEADFCTAVENGTDVVLETDILVASGNTVVPWGKLFRFAKSMTVYLDGHTIGFGVEVRVEGDSPEVPTHLLFVDGNIRIDVDAVDRYDGIGIAVMNGAALLMENVDFFTNLSGICIHNSTVEIEDSKVQALGFCAVFTNRGCEEANIVVRGSRVSAHNDENGDNVGLFFGAKGSVVVDDSEVVGDIQAVVLRSGEHEIRNSRLVATGLNDDSSSYENTGWNDTINVPRATLVVGNRYSYDYLNPTHVVLENVVLDTPEKNLNGVGYHAMYVYQDSWTNTVEVEGSVEYEGNPMVNLGAMNYATFAVDKVYVGDFSQFQCVISEGLIPNIVFLNDLDLSGMGFSVLKDISFDLNGKILTSGYIQVDDAKATFCNGILVVNTSCEVGIELTSDSWLCLDNVEYRTEKQGIAVAKFACNARIDVLNGSKVFAKIYGIVTNAAVDSTGKVSENIKVNVIGSSVSTEGSDKGDDVAILFNVKGSVCIEDSEILGDRQAVILRGGEGHVIRNSTLRVTGNNEVSKEYLDGYWGGGNEVPLAVLVVGNRSKEGYRYPTSVVLDGARISAPEKNNAEKNYFAMYVYQSERMTLNTVKVEGTVRYSGECSNVNSNMNGAAFALEELI